LTCLRDLLFSLRNLRHINAWLDGKGLSIAATDETMFEMGRSLSVRLVVDTTRKEVKLPFWYSKTPPMDNGFHPGRLVCGHVKDLVLESRNNLITSIEMDVEVLEDSEKTIRHVYLKIFEEPPRGSVDGPSDVTQRCKCLYSVKWIQTKIAGVGQQANAYMSWQVHFRRAGLADQPWAARSMYNSAFVLAECLCTLTFFDDGDLAR